MLPTFPSLAPSDRVNHDRREIIASPRPGVPPVYTGYWTAADWQTWNAQCDRVRRLQREADAAGYRLIAV